MSTTSMSHRDLIYDMIDIGKTPRSVLIILTLKWLITSLRHAVGLTTIYVNDGPMLVLHAVCPCITETFDVNKNTLK